MLSDIWSHPLLQQQRQLQVKLCREVNDAALQEWTLEQAKQRLVFVQVWKWVTNQTYFVSRNHIRSNFLPLSGAFFRNSGMPSNIPMYANTRIRNTDRIFCSTYRTYLTFILIYLSTITQIIFSDTPLCLSTLSTPLHKQGIYYFHQVFFHISSICLAQYNTPFNIYPL